MIPGIANFSLKCRLPPSHCLRNALSLAQAHRHTHILVYDALELIDRHENKRYKSQDGLFFSLQASICLCIRHFSSPTTVFPSLPCTLQLCLIELSSSSLLFLSLCLFLFLFSFVLARLVPLSLSDLPPSSLAYPFRPLFVHPRLSFPFPALLSLLR